MLYATVLGWPGSTMTITTLNSNQINLSTLTSAQLLGNTAGTYINLPKPHPGRLRPAPHHALVQRAVQRPGLRGQADLLRADPHPGRAGRLPTGWAKIANVTTGLVLDSGGNVASGSNLKQWTYDGSTNLQWQFVDLGSGYYRIVNRTNGMVADSWGNTANGAPARQAAWNGGNNQQWRLNSLGNGRYQIVNRGTGTALDGMGSTTAGSTTVMWTPNGSTNNQWTITGV